MTKWEPKNDFFSDIFYRLQSNMPITSGYTCREQIVREWKDLEERIEKFYKLKQEKL